MCAKIDEFPMSAEPHKYFLKVIWGPRKINVVSEIAFYQGALYPGSSVYEYFLYWILDRVGLQNCQHELQFYRSKLYRKQSKNLSLKQWMTPDCVCKHICDKHMCLSHLVYGVNPSDMSLGTLSLWSTLWSFYSYSWHLVVVYRSALMKSSS